MNRTLSSALFGLCIVSFSSAVPAQERVDIDRLHQIANEVRAEIRALRAQIGIRGEDVEGRREGRGEHGEGRREGRGEHGERGGERRGEHGKGGEEESGKRLRKDQTWDETRNGARLILAYDAAARSFRGTVENVTKRALSQVRVEVHLSNGVELGPTRRTDLEPDKKIRVELSAADQEFEWWTTHPEHGSEEGHGEEHGEREGRGEHGRRGAADDRPENSALRPLYNELLLLRQEVRMLRESLRKERRGEHR